MKIKDRLTLVNSKFRVRKSRTVVTVITSGILFGVIISILFITKGFLVSIENTSKKTFGNDVVIMVNHQTDGLDNQEVRDNAIGLYKQSTDKDKQYPVVDPGVINGTTFPPYLDTNNKFAIAAAQTFGEKQTLKSEKDVAQSVDSNGGKVVGSVSSYCAANPIFINKLTPDGLDGVTGGCFASMPGELIRVVDGDVLSPIIKDVKQKDDVIQIVIPIEQAAKILDISVPNSHNPNPISSLKDFVNKINNRAIGFQFKGTQIVNNQKTELTYEIVGILPSYDISTVDPFSVNLLEKFYSSLSSTNDYTQSFIVTNPKSTAFKSAYNYNFGGYRSDILASFKDIESADSFIKKIDPLSKNSADDFIANQVKIYYQFMNLDCFIVGFAVALTIVASIIMAGTVSRVIDDERQTIALYRAVGATTGDIVNIFASYIFTLSVLIAISAVVIGLLISAAITIMNTGLITANIAAMYDLSALSPIIFVGFDVRICYIVLAIIFAGLICLTLVLKKLVSKNIIRDMRG